jgi:hypothetical protein
MPRVAAPLTAPSSLHGRITGSHSPRTRKPVFKCLDPAGYSRDTAKESTDPVNARQRSPTIGVARACLALAVLGCTSQSGQSPAAPPAADEQSPTSQAAHEANQAGTLVLQRAHRALDLNDRLTEAVALLGSRPRRLHQRLLDLLGQCRTDCDAPILARGWTFVAVVRREGLNDQDGAVEAMSRVGELDPFAFLRAQEVSHPLARTVRWILRDEERCNRLVAKTVRSAMDGHYRGGDYDQAERKLRATLDELGQLSCLKRARAKVWRLLGIVLAQHERDGVAARAAFARAVHLDPRAELEESYASSESLAWYRQVRGGPPKLTVVPPAPSIVKALEQVASCDTCEAQLRARSQLLIGVYAADVLDDPFAAHQAYCSARHHDRTVKAGRVLSAAAQQAFHSERCDLP